MHYEYALSFAGQAIKHNGKFIRVDRQKLDPLGGGSFVSIAYYETTTCEIIGIIF